ncbi:hypothetical protein BDZ91DRAFT_698618 [Kalaharituber pfeilii]|nr:hypothetical protein BDZ91DRAFT_698618 [Kalaharituber pfeilii]
MQFTTIVAALLATATAVVASPVIEARGDEIFYCAEQPYKKSDYTCYPKNNYLLCPITGGVVYLPCGNRPWGACYDPANYGCNNGQLYPVSTCNGIHFDKNSYVCVDGFLCPKTHPNRCGDACYNTSQYWCDNGKLKQVGQR